jgi:hypothetical protein
MTDDDLERIWKEAVVAEQRYYHGTCLQGMVKTKKPQVMIPGAPGGFT